MESGPGDVMGPASGGNRREARLSAIVAIHTEVSAATFDPAQVADAIASHTQAITSARGVVVGILEGGSLEVLASKGLDLVPDDAHSTLVTDLVRLGIQRGGVETIPDVEADRRISGPQNTKAWIRSAIVSAIYSGGEFVGSIVATDSAGDEFADSDVQTLQIMAGLAGTVLTRTRMDRAMHPVAASPSLEVLRYQMLQDPLTNLPNRSLLFDRLRQAIALSKREDAPLAVLSLDLDDFSALNARHGEGVGDTVLQQVAGRLSSTLRASDTVARVGRDEFAVVLPRANAIGGLGTANKILRAIREPAVVGGQTIPVSASVGIAIYPEHGEDPEVLLEHADDALQRAKRSGTGYAVYATP